MDSDFNSNEGPIYAAELGRHFAAQLEQKFAIFLDEFETADFNGNDTGFS
jgi:hypothetical protein